MANDTTPLQDILNHVATLPDGPEKIGLLQSAIDHVRRLKEGEKEERYTARKEWSERLMHLLVFLLLCLTLCGSGFLVHGCDRTKAAEIELEAAGLKAGACPKAHWNCPPTGLAPAAPASSSR